VYQTGHLNPPILTGIRFFVSQSPATKLCSRLKKANLQMYVEKKPMHDLIPEVGKRLTLTGREYESIASNDCRNLDLP
jgi:hypothetical protein